MTTFECLLCVDFYFGINLIEAKFIVADNNPVRLEKRRFFEKCVFCGCAYVQAHVSFYAILKIPNFVIMEEEDF